MFWRLLGIFCHCQKVSHLAVNDLITFSSLDSLNRPLTPNPDYKTKAPSFAFSSLGFPQDPYLIHLFTFIRSEPVEPVQVFKEK